MGTIFERSKLPISSWVHAILYLACEQEHPTSVELATLLKVTQSTAWKMLNLLNRAARTRSFNRELVDLGIPHKRLPAKLSQPVQDALVRITDGINLSTGLDHPSDLKYAERVLKETREEGHRLRFLAIQRWAIAHNWDADSAAQLSLMTN